MLQWLRGRQLGAPGQHLDFDTTDFCLVASTWPVAPVVKPEKSILQHLNTHKKITYIDISLYIHACISSYLFLYTDKHKIIES